jgi:hypothetical protein
MGLNPVPEFINRVLRAVCFFVWGAGEGAHSPGGISGWDVLVVALVFCKGFLKNRDPEGGVRADACKQGFWFTIVFPEGKQVVNNHGVRYSEGVEVDTVDAVGAKLVDVVQEKILDAARCLGKSSACGEEPAVSNGTLFDVVNVDTIRAKERVVGTVSNEGSRPGDLFLSVNPSIVVLFIEFGPVEGLRPVDEISICVQISSIVDRVEIDIIQRSFVAVLGG